MTIGQRVRNARETLGYTQEELASELSGVRLDRDAVGSIEKDERSVKAAELYEIARVLDQPLVHFLREETPPEIVTVTRPVNTAEDREAVRAELRLRRHLDDYAEAAQLVEPGLTGSLAKRLARRPTRGPVSRQAHTAARQQRKRLNQASGSIPALCGLVENGLAVPVFGHAIPDTDFCGLLATREQAGQPHDQPWAMLVNTKLSPARRRFTIARQLGRLVWKSSAQDYTPEAFYSSDPADSEGQTFANVFAAEFLVPLEDLRRECPRAVGQSDPDSIMALAVRFGVSFQAMTWRLVALGRFDEHLARELIASEQPIRLPSFRLEHQEFDELSHRFRDCVARAYLMGHLSEGRCAEMLDTSTHEFVAMITQLTAQTSAECAPENAFSATG